MSELIGFKADPQLKKKLDEFAQKYFQGNRSMVIKQALEQFMGQYEENQIQDVKEEIEELRKELLMVKASVQQLLSERE